jgi:opacity protein-like surface antigen
VKQCRRIVVAAAGLLATMGPATAADAYGAPPTAEAYAASGFYLRGDAGWQIAGGGVGYQWNPMFRTDLRFDYGFNYRLGDDKLDFGTATANAYVDLPLNSVIKPYVGAGVGYGFINADSGDDHDGVAMALTGGVTFDVSSIVAIDVGYRYRRVWGDFDLDEHQVMAGLRFKF